MNSLFDKYKETIVHYEIWRSIPVSDMRAALLREWRDRFPDDLISRKWRIEIERLFDIYREHGIEPEPQLPDDDPQPEPRSERREIVDAEYTIMDEDQRHAQQEAAQAIRETAAASETVGSLSIHIDEIVRPARLSERLKALAALIALEDSELLVRIEITRRDPDDK